MDVAAWPIILWFLEPDKKPPTMERFAPYMLKVFQREPTSTQEQILREAMKKKGEGNLSRVEIDEKDFPNESGP